MALPLNYFLEKTLGNSSDWRIFLLANWNDIMGDLAPRVRLEKIETLGIHNILTLGVYESVWMQELHMLSHVLIRTINQKLGEAIVTQLRFKLTIHQKQVLRPAFDKQESSRTGRAHLTQQEHHALIVLNNPELAEALKKFLFRCTQT